MSQHLLSRVNGSYCGAMITERISRKGNLKTRCQLKRPSQNCRQSAVLLRVLFVVWAVIAAGCAQHRFTPIRVAVVDRMVLQMATSDWARMRVEKGDRKEALPPTSGPDRKAQPAQSELQRGESTDPHTDGVHEEDRRHSCRR